MDNIALTSAQRLATLVNDSSLSNYQLGVHFNIGAIAAVTRQDGRNTRAMIEYLGVSKPAIPVYYWRSQVTEVLSLMNQAEQAALPYPLNFPIQTSDVVALLKTATGLDLKPYEYVNKQITALDSDVEIEFTAASPAWLPGSVRIPAVVNYSSMTEDGEVFLNEDGTVQLLEEAA